MKTVNSVEQCNIIENTQRERKPLQIQGNKNFYILLIFASYFVQKSQDKSKPIAAQSFLVSYIVWLCFIISNVGGKYIHSNLHRKGIGAGWNCTNLHLSFSEYVCGLIELLCADFSSAIPNVFIDVFCHCFRTMSELFLGVFCIQPSF